MASFVVMTLWLGTSWAFADQPQPPAAATTSECTALTGEAVMILLEGMGYEPKDIKDELGQLVGASIRVEGSLYSYTVDLSLSGNKQWLWMTIGLKNLPDPKVPAEVLSKLLGANSVIGPNFFAYHEKDNVFELKRPILNRGIKAADIRQALTRLDQDMKTYAEAWDPDKWPGAKPATTAK
jgi:hypothetical protein